MNTIPFIVVVAWTHTAILEKQHLNSHEIEWYFNSSFLFVSQLREHNSLISKESNL